LIVGLVVGLGTWLAVGVMGLPPGGITTRRRWGAHVAVAIAAPILCGMLGGYVGLASPARIPLTCVDALHGAERSACFDAGRRPARSAPSHVMLSPGKRKAPVGTGAFQTLDVMRARRGYRTG
jgi:hypothetical protein